MAWTFENKENEAVLVTSERDGFSVSSGQKLGQHHNKNVSKYNHFKNTMMFRLALGMKWIRHQANQLNKQQRLENLKIKKTRPCLLQARGMAFR